MQIGEAVVHEGYASVATTVWLTWNLDGVRKDYLKLTYANEDVVYLPMKALDQMQKYVGTGGKMPKLSRLGGGLVPPQERETASAGWRPI